MMDRKCENCEWWERWKTGIKGTVGICRRFPPKESHKIYTEKSDEYEFDGITWIHPCPSESTDISYYPKTNDIDWCGEFKPKQKDGE